MTIIIHCYLLLVRGLLNLLFSCRIFCQQVMIVCVNPFDTGFDENSQVMKFSAVAKDVMTVQQVSVRVDHGQRKRYILLMNIWCSFMYSWWRYV